LLRIDVADLSVHQNPYNYFPINLSILFEKPDRPKKYPAFFAGYFGIKK